LQAVNYAVTIPADAARSLGKLACLPQMDLAHDLCGVEASWTSSDNKQTWSGWLPHLDPKVSRTFTAASAKHEALWTTLPKAGDLVLRTELDLWQMLRAATQPISKLDFQYPDETITVVFKANAPLVLKSDAAKVEATNERESRLTVVAPKQDKWIPVEIRLRTLDGQEPSLEVSWFTAEDSRSRALPLRRMFLPWAMPAESKAPVELKREIPEIAGGNWLRGKKIFFGDKVACSKCHTTRKEGGHVGPDLSNLVERDYASVMKDITKPSAAINPDHIAYNVELRDGETITAIPAGEQGDELFFLDASAKKTGYRKSQVVSMKPSMLSLMPEGLLAGLNEQQVKDLLTFLLIAPLEPAPISIRGEPPPRKRSELDSVLKASASASSTNPIPMRIVLCSGPKDHGPDEHDYPLWQNRWSKLLGFGDEVTVETTADWPSDKQLSSADVIVFYSNNPGWSAQRATELDGFLNRGGGLVYLHYAVDGHDNYKELAQRIGLAWRGGACKFRHGPVDLVLQPHDITRGLEKVSFIDETYWQLIGDKANYQLLGSGMEDNAPQPQVWVREQGKGRVFVSILGHYTWTFDDPLFRLLILRGLAWTAHQPVDRFNELLTIGAKVAD
jgi:putative heme-binding domain-containing protein